MTVIVELDTGARTSWALLARNPASLVDILNNKTINWTDPSRIATADLQSNWEKVYRMQGATDANDKKRFVRAITFHNSSKQAGPSTPRLDRKRKRNFGSPPASELRFLTPEVIEEDEEVDYVLYDKEGGEDDDKYVDVDNDTDADGDVDNDNEAADQDEVAELHDPTIEMLENEESKDTAGKEEISLKFTRAQKGKGKQKEEEKVKAKGKKESRGKAKEKAAQEEQVILEEDKERALSVSGSEMEVTVNHLLDCVIHIANLDNTQAPEVIKVSTNYEHMPCSGVS